MYHLQDLQIFAIIVTYNGEKWIKKCLSSLRSSSLKTSIIIVDNGSTDQTIPIIEKEFSEVQLIKSSKNLGFGQGNNLGISRALQNGADYIFLLNQDAWVEPNTIETLIKVAEKNRSYGIISPLHLNGQGNQLDWNFSNYIIPRYCPKIYSDALIGNKLNDLYDAKYVNAAAWLLPARTVKKVGGFDPLFFHYGEDDNYLQRVRYHGFKIGICPLVKIYHDREHREESKLKKQTDKHKKVLIQFADVNKNGPKELAQRIRLLNKGYWPRAIMGFKTAKNIKKEIKLLKQIQEEVAASWEKNRKPGLHYL